MLKISELAELVRQSSLDEVVSNFRYILSTKFNTNPHEPINAEGIREPMDTLGSLIDKLAIITTRMWHAQDDLYRFRNMTDEEWLQEFESNPSKVKRILIRACELNLQRNQLIDEIDKLNITQLNLTKEDQTKLYQPKHKMY